MAKWIRSECNSQFVVRAHGQRDKCSYRCVVNAHRDVIKFQPPCTGRAPPLIRMVCTRFSWINCHVQAADRSTGHATRAFRPRCLGLIETVSFTRPDSPRPRIPGSEDGLCFRFSRPSWTPRDLLGFLFGETFAVAPFALWIIIVVIVNRLYYSALFPDYIAGTENC